MADPSENTPLLTRDDRLTSHDEHHSHQLKTSPAKAGSRFSITILRSLVSLLSLSIFGILLATHAQITTFPFDYVENSKKAVRVLAIIALVNMTVCTLTVFLQTPIVFNIPLTLTMVVVLLIFSDHLIGEGWPDAEEGYYKIFCVAIWRSPNDRSPDPKCERARNVIKILMGFTSGIGIMIALLLVTVLLLELKALSKGGTKLTAQIGVGSAQTERPADAASALLIGDEEI